MRLKIVLALVGVLLVAAGLYWWLGRSQPVARQGVIEIVNVPDHYCPTQSSILVTDTNVKAPQIILDSTAPVTECRFIELSNLLGLGNVSRLVYVKLPFALAFGVEVYSPQGNYQYSPLLGDVNSNNIIDGADEQQVAGAMFSTDPKVVSQNDIDQDKAVTVLDLGLTRVNRRVGIDRPDAKAWSKT